jgi:hypothetical protein
MDMLIRNIILAALGVWFALSSWILTLTSHPAYVWTAPVLGVVTIALALWALLDRKPMAWRPIVMSLVGLWFAVLAVLGFGASVADTLVTFGVGIVTLYTGIWEAQPRPSTLRVENRKAA